MTPEKHERIKEVFLAACSLSAEGRGAFLEWACGEDRELRQQIDELFRHHSGAIAARSSSSIVSGEPIRVRFGDSPADAAVSAPPAARRSVRAFEPGDVLAGRYRIVSLVGRGGMGEVYRADDMQLEQTVALKFLPAPVSKNPFWLARLFQEVRIARQVTHPNVCRVFDVGEADGEHFISMEYVEGKDLATLLKQIKRIPQDKALEISRQLCAGLAAAHAKGIVHRDLKPANILLDEQGEVRITDFGLAVMREHGDEVPIRAGTPAYMAPEQLAGSDVSVRSDIYSLGLVFYELFTGKSAFDEASISDDLRISTRARPVRPSRVIPGLDPAIDSAILSCLQPDPMNRPSSALMVATELPGGNVLALATDARLTPSPELVAEAGDSERAQIPVAIAELVAFLLMILALAGLARSDETQPYGRLDKPPAVLAESAREILRTLGRSGSPADEAFGFSVDAHREFGASLHQRELESNRRFATKGNQRLVFWYRRSERPLMPTDAMNLLFGPSRTRLADPPDHSPGMTTVLLDPAGRLLGFEDYPDKWKPSGLPVGSVDWTPLLDYAGLGGRSLTPAIPVISLRACTDTRASWVGIHPDDESRKMRVEAASSGGRPVFFAVWQDRPEPGARPFYRSESFRKSIVLWTRMIVLSVLVVVAIPLARSNLNNGRSDRRGAYRVAVFVALARFAVWVLLAHHQSDVEVELRLLVPATVGILAEVMLVWIFYIALEPYVRKFWPESLVSWSRLLTGRLRDPLVGRSILLGGVFGAFWALAVKFDPLATLWLNLEPRESWRDPNTYLSILGSRQAVAVCIHTLRNAVYLSLEFLLLIVVFRILFRRPLLAGALTVLVISLLYVPRGSHPLVSWVLIGLCVVGVAVWVVVRLGLLALTTGVFVSGMLSRFPVTFDFQRGWEAEVGIFAVGTVAAVTLWGFVIACGLWSPLRPSPSRSSA